MKFLFIALAVMLSVLPAAAQDAISVSTSVAEYGGRYEIIQPPFDKTTTFRLDRYSGTVHRLATCPKDDSLASRLCWKEMTVVDLPKGSTVFRPRFQIFINGPARLITLMQVETGQTWQYGIEPTDKWYPFIECTDKASPTCFWKPFT